MGFSTDAIHVGQEPDALTGSIVAPIYQTSTYVIEEMGKSKGYDYARTNHPNRKALERTIAKLEGGLPRMSLLPEWRRLMPSSACCARATILFFLNPCMAVFSASPRNFSSSSDWNSVTWTLPIWKRYSKRLSRTRK